MSTDQITPNRPVTLEPSGWAGRPVRLVVVQNSKDMRTAIPLTLGELEAIVQQAYDLHGIVATPSWTKEAQAGRAIEDAREVSDQADYLAAHDPAQTTIEEQIHDAEADARRGECTELTCPTHGPANRATRANLDALRAKLTGEVR